MAAQIKAIVVSSALPRRGVLTRERLMQPKSSTLPSRDCQRPGAYNVLGGPHHFVP